MGEESETKAAGVLSRAFALLDAVEIRPMTASDLARAVGLSTSTTHRLAVELVRFGFLRKDGQGRYCLGHRFFTTAVADLAQPVLRELSGTTGETSQLWVRRGHVRMCVASVESLHELRSTVSVGSSFALPLGSSGHVLSGEFDDDPDARSRGWWQTVSERVSGLCSVSAPVRVHGEIIAAVCVSGPSHRLGDNFGELLGPAVVDAARHIEKSLTDV